MEHEETIKLLTKGDPLMALCTRLVGPKVRLNRFRIAISALLVPAFGFAVPSSLP
jgi:hypothetical protein